ARERNRRAMAGLVMILGCGWAEICPPTDLPVTLVMVSIGDCVLVLFGIYLILTAGWARSTAALSWGAEHVVGCASPPRTLALVPLGRPERPGSGRLPGHLRIGSGTPLPGPAPLRWSTLRNGSHGLGSGLHRHPGGDDHEVSDQQVGPSDTARGLL